MELVFVRHGQPAWSRDGLSQVDPGLTALGREQADRAAARLGSEPSPVAELLVSPAARAQETAAPIAAATGVTPTTVDGLTEIQMPDWTGTPVETVETIFRDARHRSPDHWWDGLPGGESFREFHARITTAMRTVLAERSVVPDPGAPAHLWRVATDPRRIVIVAHAGTNAVALGFLLGLEPTPWEWERFLLAHASFARLRAIPLAGGHVFSLRTFNDVEHLPRDLRSR
jgi:broad specificity phosphatase PhoE